MCLLLLSGKLSRGTVFQAENQWKGVKGREPHRQKRQVIASWECIPDSSEHPELRLKVRKVRRILFFLLGRNDLSRKNLRVSSVRHSENSVCGRG